MSSEKVSKRARDPLSCIPSAAVVEARLQRVLSEAAKLKVLLRTANEIEAAQSGHVSESGHEGSEQ